MRCLLEKLILLWRLLKVTGEGSERKAEIYREYTQKVIYRILVEIRMVIAILMRSQAEIRNMLLTTENVALVMKWQIKPVSSEMDI